MADFLVMTVDKTGVEQGYKKGDIVEVFPDGRLQPQPVDVPFVLIRVPGMTVNQALHGEWRQHFGYEVIASNAQGFRIRVFSTLARPADNLGGITRAQVETFIVSHGGTVQSVSQNEVVFDIGRDNVDALKEDIREKVEDRFVRRRLYRVPGAAVDAALTDGGVMTYTETQVMTYLTRKSD